MTSTRLLSVIHGPVFGGAHNQLVSLAPALAASGIETVAALPPEAETAARRIEAAGIEVVRMPLSSLRATADPRTHARSLLSLRRDIRGLRGAIRKTGAGVVQVHGVINPHAGLAAQLEDVAVVWQLLDTRAPMALRRVTMPVVTRIADAITSWGNALADGHPGASSLGERCVIVYPPVDPDLEPDEKAAATARERLGIPSDASAIGTIGVRNTHKRHEYFVRAAGRIAKRYPKAVFRVLGAPSPPHADYMAAVEREAEQLGLARPRQIDFIDPGNQATALLQGLDVFVLASPPNSEGMPTVILEAMACGKPVVASDVGAVHELVEDKVTGFVVPAEDPGAVAIAVERLLDDAELRERIGAVGRDRAVAKFGLERLAELHLGAYRAALEHRRLR